MLGRPRSVATAAALAATLLAAGTVALAVHREGHTVVSGGGITAVTAVADTQAQAFKGDTGIAFLDGASVKMSVPSGQRAFFVATFSAESECESFEDSGPGQCFAFVRMGGDVPGTDLNPRDDDTAFDTSSCIGPGSCPGDGLEAHSIQRSSGIVGPGTYTFRVGVFAIGAPTIFRLDDWHFTVERVVA